MPELTKAQIAKDVNKYVVRFVPKYRVFRILQNNMQNNIEYVVKKSTQMWKVTYGLTTTKEGEEEPIEVKDDEEHDDKEKIVRGEIKMEVDDEETSKPEHPKEQGVQEHNRQVLVLHMSQMRLLK